jgi:hypothetical protein
MLHGEPKQRESNEGRNADRYFPNALRSFEREARLIEFAVATGYPSRV